jgi:hypothetical protein
MKDARTVRVLVCAVGLACAAAGTWYLYDPPWVGTVTSGMRDWEEDLSGTRFRWTAGHASFFVPSSAAEMTVPVRAVFASPDGGPVVVRMAVDDRLVATLELKDPSEWARPVLTLPRHASRRRYRRVDVRVSRVVGFGNLGVELGQPTFR